MNQVSFKAGAAVRAAREVHAEQRAPYEMAAAEEYLTKAREEGGRSEYETAIRLGKKAEELALKAKAMTVGRRLTPPPGARLPGTGSSPGAPTRGDGTAKDAKSP